MKSKDFKAVYANGRSAADKNLVLYILDTDLGCMRYGFSVSRRIGNSVVRHRITRRLRAICLTRLSDFQGSFDMVIIARQNVVNASYEELSQSAVRLLKRTGKIKK